MRPVRHGEVEIRGSEKGRGLVEKWVVTAGPGAEKWHYLIYVWKGSPWSRAEN